MGSKKDTDNVKAKLRCKRDKPKPVPARRLLSTGATRLDLACANSAVGGIAMGSYVYLVGDSDSGKTWLTMSCLAEAAINRRFDEYRFIYDPAEGGAQMDIEYYFGKGVKKRMIHPEYDEDGVGTHSAYVEDFYINLDRHLGLGPCIYILDSMDSLNPRVDDKKFDTDAEDIEAGKDTSGTWGTAKAKLNSVSLRRVIPKLRKTGSILIIISQTRDRIGFGAQFNPKTRAGGRALKFYADLEVWCSVKGHLSKTVRGKKRAVGNTVLCKVKRSRITGRMAETTLPIYHEFGIDNIGSMVEYLVEEKHWGKAKGSSVIKATDFEFSGSLDKIVKQIEENDLEAELKVLVRKVWREIINASRVERTRRYK